MEPIETAAPIPGAREGTGTDKESDTEDAIKDDDDGGGKATLKEAVTRSGRITSKPTCYIEEIGAVTSDYEIGLTVSEIRYYASMEEFPESEFAPGEIVCIGAGLGGGFSNTSEPHVMKYKKVMAVDQEHDRMVEWSMDGSAKGKCSARREDLDLNLGDEEEIQWGLSSPTQCKRIRAS
jgi:hypothetical protein